MLKKQNILDAYWLGGLAIILAISAPWFDLSVSNHSFIKTYIAGIGISILTLLILLKKHNNYNILYHVSYIKILLGLTFLLGFLSIFWSNNADFSITKILIWVTIFMAFYTAYNIDINENSIHKFSFLLLIAVGLIAIIGILQYLFDPFSLTQAATPSSTFGNRNMATQPLSMVFPLAVYLILSQNINTVKLWVVSILTALILTFIFYTSTRAAWIAITGEIFLITLFLFFKRKSFHSFASWNKEKTIASFASFVLFLFLINFNTDGFYPFWEKLFANFDRLGDSIDSAKDLRYQIWKIAREMVADSPFFGSGIGTWFHNLVQEGYSSYKINYVQRVHNDLLEMAVSIGLVGVSIFLLAVIAIMFAVWKIILTAEAKFVLFYFMLFTSLSGSFINMQFSFPYQLAMPALLFGFYIGLIAKKSEEFIRPIKEFKFDKKIQLAKLYKNSVLSINLIIFIIINSLYMSWINMYSNLNHINKTRTYQNLSIVETPVYHLEIQNIMNFLTAAYLQSNIYDVAEKSALQMLKYWPNDYVTQARYANILQHKKQYNKALIEAKKARKISPINSLFASSILFHIYFKTKQYDEYIKLFEKIFKIPEKVLSDNPKNYKTLISQALRVQVLQKYITKLYELHNKYGSYDCGTENNIIYYYLLTNNNNKLMTVFLQEIKNSKNCLNKNLINQVKLKLKSKNL